MNPVFANPASRHDDEVTGIRLFHMGRFAPDLPWHDAPCSAVNQGLSKVTIVKNNAAVDRGNTAFVSSVFHPFSYSFINPLGVKQAGREGFRVEGGRKTKRIHVEDELGTLPGSKGITVAPHDARQRAPIRIERRRGVV